LPRVLIAALLCLAATVAVRSEDRSGDGPSFPKIEDHFKYGSVGAEERNGFPYWIWRVLPELCADKLPKRPGTGWERIGFISDGAPHGRPIGTSYRPGRGDRVGLNCATCHVGTLRETPSAPRRVMLGMPANQMDLQGYARFLTACASDPRFNAGDINGAIRKINPNFGWFKRLSNRLFVVGAARKAILERARENSWFDSRPPQLPGRVDTFNPYRVILKVPFDDTVGTSDLPSLWNQRPREGLWLHWDGNNNSVAERNKSAAIGAGASPKSLDLASLKRIEDWIWDLQAPKYPANRINQSLAGAGKPVYEKYCASCHALGAAKIGQVTPLAEIDTDPERLNNFSETMAKAMNQIGDGYPWRFSHFRKTNGYANAPLDGIWLRAPYLHNGSVPDLRSLLSPNERPTRFYRSYDVYDWDRVGFVATGPDAEREGVLHDTTLRGNSNRGHTYGAELTADQKRALLEYLKTL
jgi:mono/diheme cytochrome c family protein